MLTLNSALTLNAVLTLYTEAGSFTLTTIYQQIKITLLLHDGISHVSEPQYIPNYLLKTLATLQPSSRASYSDPEPACCKRELLRFDLHTESIN